VAKKLEDTAIVENDLIEVREGPRIDGRYVDSVLEVRVGSDIRIAVRIGDDLGFIASVVAAIRRAE
jgi:hypothetical protein